MDTATHTVALSPLLTCRPGSPTVADDVGAARRLISGTRRINFRTGRALVKAGLAECVGLGCEAYRFHGELYGRTTWIELDVYIPTRKLLRLEAKHAKYSAGFDAAIKRAIKRSRKK